MKKQNINTIYIGYDPKEHKAYEVLKFSLERISTSPLRIVTLDLHTLQNKMGVYKRKFKTDSNGQRYDNIDNRPFSSDFSFSRFLVPYLNMYQGKALYMDCDMYVRHDITELFDLCDNDYYALWCVHHKYEPTIGKKMDNKIQEMYHRKNWSSLMMFNCDHQDNRKLTKDLVNIESGRFLHTFQWLPDKEADIGRIPEEWNWLDGHSDPELDAKNVHFTTGGPWFNGWNPSREEDCKYITEWNNDAAWLEMKGIKEDVKKFEI